ncbi:MAG: putative collagen-binding domain-containing protein, partial [Anaerolineae bacterium]|nr:putative collagen-binding domain-containing protein [Anaerolineae bacterium]
VNPGHEYVVYLPHGGEVTVDLRAASGSLAVEWIHPLEGPALPGGSVAGGGERRFTVPFEGGAVLYLSALGGG